MKRDGSIALSKKKKIILGSVTKPMKTENRFRGLDVETPMGNLQVIATDEEAREVSTFSEVCDFLLQRKYRGSIFHCFNLRFDGEAMLKATGDIVFLKELHMNGADGVWYNDKIKVRWISSKYLQICEGKRETNKVKRCIKIYDIAQFWKGWKLDKVARKYLGDYKNPIDGERLGSEPGYYEARKTEVMEYCRKDAELTLRAAKLMQETIENTKLDIGSLSFRNPISQAKISELYVKDNFDYPKIPKGIEKFHYFAYKTYHGGIFSTLKRGFFNQKLFSYDINSAYPYQLQSLPHWGNGVFETIAKPITNKKDKDYSKYGWYKCEFDCEWIPYADYNHAHVVEMVIEEIEVAVKLNPKRKIYPTGKRVQWITKIEYEWMKKRKFYVKFIAGFEWVKTSDKYDNPFRWCEEVYKRRKEITRKDVGDVREYALKIVLNGIYGKTAQAKRGMGSLTNFFYASYITAGTRIQICDAIHVNPGAVIEIATDSILSTEPLSVKVSEKLGDWSLRTYEKGLLIGSGMRQLWEDEKTYKSAARGLTDKTDWDMISEIRNGYNDKEKRPNIACDYLYFVKTRPYHLGEVLFHHKLLSLEDLIVFTPMKKKLRVNTDCKREWERDYLDFGDLLNSPPQSSKPLKMENIKSV